MINYGADTNLICGWQVNPDLVDCLDKHDRAVECILHGDNIKHNMYDPDSFFFLFVSCQMEIVTRLNFDKWVWMVADHTILYLLHFMLSGFTKSNTYWSWERTYGVLFLWLFFIFFISLLIPFKPFALVTIIFWCLRLR